MENNLKKLFKEKTEVAGIIKFTNYDCQSIRAANLERDIVEHARGFEQITKSFAQWDLRAAEAASRGWAAIEEFVAWSESPEGQAVFETMYKMKQEHDNIYQEMIAEMRRSYFKKELVQENLICVNGRAAVMGRLANITTYTGIINYGVVGTGTNAPNESDTQLQTELARATVTSTSQTTYTAYINIFFSMASFNNTATEFATVIDGTASANTGRIWTRMKPSGGWAKSSSESMTVACVYPMTYVP